MNRLLGRLNGSSVHRSCCFNKKLPALHVINQQYSTKTAVNDANHAVDIAHRSGSSMLHTLQKGDVLTIFHRPSDSIADFTSAEFKSVQWQSAELKWNDLVHNYKKLTKFGLTRLVVVSALAGYAMAPGACLDISTILAVCSGTFLCSAAAISTNQLMEIPYDSQMNRTNVRPLVRRYISPTHATMFSLGSLSLGSTILWLGANPLTAGLGFLNYILYAFVYTPLKRVHISNTWAGAIVGAIPPMMGWAACTGSLEPGAFLMGSLLYCWQFPHFNGLSWKLRPEYSRAGYHMAAVTHPDLCKRVAFRHSLAMTGLCFLAPVMGLTSWVFPFATLPVNLPFAWLGWRFRQDSDDKSAQSSRRLFFWSLLQLPVLMIIMGMCRTDNTQEKTSDPEKVSSQKTEKLSPYCDTSKGTSVEDIILPGSKL